MRNACWAFIPSAYTCLPKSTIADICRPYLPNTNQGVVSAITVFGEGAGLGDKCQITGGVSAYVCANKLSSVAA